jgi:hypothetical protein
VSGTISGALLFVNFQMFSKNPFLNTVIIVVPVPVPEVEKSWDKIYRTVRTRWGLTKTKILLPTKHLKPDSVTYS